MGINTQTLNFLRYTKKYGNFKKTVTLGRQNIGYRMPELKRLSPAEYQYLREYRKKETYVDNLLRDFFLASLVDSIDKSDYEGATIIFDMNNEIFPELKGKYDTVLDSGTLEHIFNIPQALDNTSSLCKPGGQIIHALPANNFSGHGFWQISPELFFSLYSDKNGYRDTEVFLGSKSDPNNFYKVIQPKSGQRVNIYSKEEVSVYVRTVRKETEFSHKNVQQSDYLYLWDDKSRSPSTNHSRSKEFIRENAIVYKMALVALKIYEQHYRAVNSLSRRNPNLVRARIDHLLLR